MTEDLYSEEVEARQGEVKRLADGRLFVTVANLDEVQGAELIVGMAGQEDQHETLRPGESVRIGYAAHCAFRVRLLKMTADTVLFWASEEPKK